MDSMVTTALIIEREVNDAHGIRDAGASDKKRGSQASSSGSRKKQRTLFHGGFMVGAATNRAKARSGLPFRLDR